MKKYLITSAEFHTNNQETFKKKLRQQFLSHQVDYALYRDKSNTNYDAQAKDFIEICQSFKNVKSFLHQRVNLAKEFHATGVHLSSQQFDAIDDAKELGLEVIISSHTHEEVLLAQQLGADAVTYSPIFTTPNKGKPKGVQDLKELLQKCDIKVFALGGVVSQKHIQMLEEISPYGFASIRYFY